MKSRGASGQHDASHEKNRAVVVDAWRCSGADAPVEPATAAVGFGAPRPIGRVGLDDSGWRVFCSALVECIGPCSGIRLDRRGPGPLAEQSPRGYLYATPVVCVSTYGAFPDPRGSRGRIAANASQRGSGVRATANPSACFTDRPLLARWSSNHAVTHAIATANSIVSISAIALAASSVMRSPFVVTSGKRADRSEWQKQGNAVCPFLRCQRNGASSEPDTIPALGSVETVMEASVCPMCALALKISTIEPDGVDVVTCRCPINGDIWTSIVVNRVEVADTKIATLLP